MKLTTLMFIGFLLFGNLALLLQAQEESKRKETKSVYDELEKAPEKYRAKANPLSKDPQAATAGGILFEEHCQECHGKQALGGKKAPSLRVPEVQNAAPGAIYYILTNGVVRKGMPVWSKLPEPQRWQLVSYLKSLGVASAAAPQPAQRDKP
jgi:mono/diheme cytochrome c family protein